MESNARTRDRIALAALIWILLTVLASIRIHGPLFPALSWSWTAVLWIAGLTAFALGCWLLQKIALAAHLVLGFALVITTLYYVTHHVPLYETVLRENYLIFYFHFPSAITCLTLFLIAGLISIRHLRSGAPALDLRSASAIEVGLLACTVTLATGMVWAEAAWGQPWVWNDPRLMTVAIMWFTYMAYLMFRLAIENPSTRARFSSILAIVFAVNVPLVWFAIRLFGKQSHPMNLEFVGQDAVRMSTGKWLGAASFFVLYHAIWRLRYRLNRAEAQLDRLDEAFTRLKI